MKALQRRLAVNSLSKKVEIMQMFVAHNLTDETAKNEE